jgi:hypothetical protein
VRGFFPAVPVQAGGSAQLGQECAEDGLVRIGEGFEEVGPVERPIVGGRCRESKRLVQEGPVTKGDVGPDVPGCQPADYQRTISSIAVRRVALWGRMTSSSSGA